LPSTTTRSANTTATFDVEPRSAEAQEQWFHEHVPPHPAIVWEEEGKVLGWASLSPYHTRCAYRFAAEASVYVAPDARRIGVGEGLLRELIRLGAENGLHTLVGQVTEENAASCRLAEKVGLRRVGTLHEVGYKFDRG
jgi:phosphinothricin acetyltransferase